MIEKNNPAASSSSVIFEVISALATTGISLGLTPTLSIISKIIIITLMFVGRVGSLTLAYAVNRKSPDAYGEIKFKETNLIVG